MIVCICKGIREDGVRRCHSEGMSFDDMQFKMGLASQCGKCYDCARKLVAETSEICDEKDQP